MTGTPRSGASAPPWAFLVGPPFLGFLGQQFGILNALLVILALMMMAGLAAPTARERSGTHAVAEG